MSDWKPIEMSPRGIDESIGYHEEKNFEWGRITGKLEGLREAAQILSNRIYTENIFEDKHKANGKHYKAREAAHVQRILTEERQKILARIAELEKP